MTIDDDGRNDYESHSPNKIDLEFLFRTNYWTYNKNFIDNFIICKKRHINQVHSSIVTGILIIFKVTVTRQL